MTDLQGWLVTFGYDLEHYQLWPEWLDGSRQQETERQFAFMCPSILIHRAMHDCIHCLKFFISFGVKFLKYTDTYLKY